MKLDFEIVVDQQTRARDRTFEGVPDSGCPLVPIFGNCWPNFVKSPKRAQNYALGCFTCSYLSPGHMYITFIKIEQKLAEL